MARFHLTAHDHLGSVRARSGGQVAAAQIPGAPAGAPALYDVVAAAKVALPSGTLYVSVWAVTGDVYFTTGFADDDNIVAPAGHYAPENVARFVGVGGTLDDPHTHLLVIAANAATDTATNLNA